MSALSWIRLSRRLALKGGLTGTYLLLVTPLAWFTRAGGTRPLGFGTPGWESAAGCAGWVPIRMDSDDRQLYLDSGTTNTKGFFGSWLQLIRAYRNHALKTPIPWSWLILLGLVPWAWAAKPPKETELSSDLYVLF